MTILWPENSQTGSRGSHLCQSIAIYMSNHQNERRSVTQGSPGVCPGCNTVQDLLHDSENAYSIADDMNPRGNKSIAEVKIFSA